MPAAASDVWRSRRAAFIQNPALDHGCACQVRFLHDSSRGEASVSLQYAANLAEVTVNPRHIVLFIRPSLVESCRIVEEEALSPYLLQYIPSTSVSGPTDVLTVALTLRSHGALHYPKELTSVRADPTEVDLASFAEICQATTIYLHFAKAQFDDQEKTRLQHLVNGLDNGGLSAPPLNLGREDRGRGLQEGTWEVFSPKASTSSHAQASSVLGKRSRQASVSSPAEPSKRLEAHHYTTPPPYSPTDIDTLTPTTKSISPNYIRPTVFTLPPYRRNPVSSSSDAQISLLANMLATVPQHVLREAIIQSGHQALLGMSGTLKPKAEVPCVKVASPRASRLSSPRLRSLVKDVFTAEFETRLKYLVESGLPLHTKDAIEKIMDEYHNQFHIDCEAAEAAIQEKVEDASLEVKMALDDGMREIEELIEEHIQKLADGYETIDALIERYTYGESPDTPQGMLQTNGIIDGKFVDWLKPVKDEIKDDLREILEGGYEDMIAVERDIYEKAMEDSNDPGKELLSELVEMIDKGLQSMPKILVTINTLQGKEIASSIELKWSYGLEDAITRLSTKVLEKEIVGTEIKKSGRDFHILYQVDDAAEDSVILALVEEMREWR
ncbi:hypothetical protein M438DRAFT_367596 [Aureobasidium pullulans EXF-150]|uniref:Uncharacterized protein n=1 Tax=Aureobasidium pullulans EXF-150 TaxID=1043002 RepID=A0A074XDC7_AURPU|nr:uncharacterized protein M438DRAFT_367596 [Aureobasidium pullulans EXF-150]KEQ81704.1 hypothetical protein M438DRAFT_367596 [Aureobasidium pullulans EXF-150]